jgi:hypothetical protein
MEDKKTADKLVREDIRNVAARQRTLRNFGGVSPQGDA